MKKICLLFIGMLIQLPLFCDNQTTALSPVYPEGGLPYQITIKQADFSLPVGIQSFVVGTHKGKWLLLAGRTNGLHGFSDVGNNFPLDQQNTMAYVVDPKKKRVWSRSLSDPMSGFSQAQIDLLSVTNAERHQVGSTLYMCGGYGIDLSTELMNTKNCLSVIELEGFIDWVMHPSSHKKASSYVRQIFNPILSVTGGYLGSFDKKNMLLIFGQNFSGLYRDSSNGEYTQQVRKFRVFKHNIKVSGSKPEGAGDSHYRRRDLNVVPMIRKKNGKLKSSLVALSGVFTTTDGVWTVPVKINSHGTPSMADQNLTKTFKQSMNNYSSANFGLFSEKRNEMYTLLLGGISYGFFSNGQFETDSEIPFLNQVTTVRVDKNGRYRQFLMSGQYPTILSTQSNPGNALLFGAEAEFIPVEGISHYKNGIIKYDSLKKSTVIGYIVGGIQSTLPNTNVISDSAASPYIFTVTIDKVD